MSDSPDPAAADDPTGSSAASRAITPEPADPPNALDAHGFDPADYDWVPVKRQRRPDGWSHDRQRSFIESLADTGSITLAAIECGMSVTSCYRLRRAPGAEGFAAAWDAAIQQASKRLVDLAFDRAINGAEEPVFDREGIRVGRRVRYNDRLLMFLLRAHQPERYRHAHQGLRHANEPAPPAPPPIAGAIAALAPAAPDAPHLLMAPDDLACALQVAEIGDGRLPHWLRDPAEANAREQARLDAEFDRLRAAPLPPADETASRYAASDEGAGPGRRAG